MVGCQAVLADSQEKIAVAKKYIYEKLKLKKQSLPKLLVEKLEEIGTGSTASAADSSGASSKVAADADGKKPHRRVMKNPKK